jgi:hypothetical protein
MAELVALRRHVGLDQPGLEQLVQRRQRGGVLQLRDLRHDREREGPLEAGGGVQEPVGIWRQARPPAGQHVPQPLGDDLQRHVGLQRPVGVQTQRLRLQQVAEHLAGEERVPAGLLLDRAGKRR